MNYVKMTPPKMAQYRFGGWAEKYLNKMLEGLTGNLNSLFYPFNTNCWLKESFQDGGLEGWWPYEQAAYWLDGYIKCAYFANNATHFEKAKAMIDGALSVVDGDGFIGSRELKEQGKGNRWVHAVFFRAVLFLYDITGDIKYVNAVKNHYLGDIDDYSKWRETVNIENMAACYLICGDARLKEKAVKAWQLHCADESNSETRLQDLVSGKPINLHAVTYDEIVKLPALLYCITGEKSYLQASIKGVQRIKKHHLLPIGMHSGSENFSGTDALSCIETCDITDYCHTLYYLARITGDAAYLDDIERIMYNVAPSVMDKDFKTLQYYSSMNQVIATHNSNHSGSFTQTPRTAYQSDHYPECCTGNANRSMPNFLLNAFMQTDAGYRFNFYIPGEYKAGGCAFEVQTEYPYGEDIKITYLGEEKTFTLQLRVPLWCKSYAYRCRQKAVLSHGLITVEGRFKKGDEISLKIRSGLEVVETGEGLAVCKQPLFYTLEIGAEIKVDETEKRQAEGYPAYDVIPTTAWQIALDKDEFLSCAKIEGTTAGNLLENDYKLRSSGYIMGGIDFKRVHSSQVPVSDYDRGEIVKLRANGQVIYEGEMIFTPDIKDLKPRSLEKTEITLVPYSTAMLRWTVFPDVNGFKTKD